MKRVSFLSLIMILSMIAISACGGGIPATATISPNDVQSTAMVAAFTVVAETHAALPTDTIVSPTETPTPTAVPTELPTLEPTETLATSLSPEPTLVPTQTSSSSTGGEDPDYCNAPLKSISGGMITKIQLENNTGAPITASIYLHLTPFGDCGFRGYNIAKGGSVLITDLVVGCYSVSVLVNDLKKPTKSFGYGCINNNDKWTFAISRDTTILVGR